MRVNINMVYPSVLKVLALLIIPCTSYRFPSKNSARYEPSWPVMPVINAIFDILARDLGQSSGRRDNRLF